jgi:hypothetical protein
MQPPSLHWKDSSRAWLSSCCNSISGEEGEAADCAGAGETVRGRGGRRIIGRVFGGRGGGRSRTGGWRQWRRWREMEGGGEGRSCGQNGATCGLGHQTHYHPCPIPSVSLVEPGPVTTDFEGKLLAQVSTAEFPGTDPDSLGYFRDLYLPASRELFRSVGQSPQEVAQVSGPADMVQVCWGTKGKGGPWIPALRAPSHRPLSRSSALPDHPCADKPTPATSH